MLRSAFAELVPERSAPEQREEFMGPDPLPRIVKCVGSQQHCWPLPSPHASSVACAALLSCFLLHLICTICSLAFLRLHGLAKASEAREPRVSSTASPQSISEHAPVPVSYSPFVKGSPWRLAKFPWRLVVSALNIISTTLLCRLRKDALFRGVIGEVPRGNRLLVHSTETYGERRGVCEAALDGTTLTRLSELFFCVPLLE